MSQQPKLSNYVSGIDQFLQQFDKTHPTLSLSQQKEKTKAQHIAEKRDHTVHVEDNTTLWKGF